MLDLSSDYDRQALEIANTPMPSEYAGWTVQILCNDCLEKSTASYHVLGHQCSKCRSLNTAVIAGPHQPATPGSPENPLVEAQAEVQAIDAAAALEAEAIDGATGVEHGDDNERDLERNPRNAAIQLFPAAEQNIANMVVALDQLEHESSENGDSDVVEDEET